MAALANASLTLPVILVDGENQTSIEDSKHGHDRRHHWHRQRRRVDHRQGQGQQLEEAATRPTTPTSKIGRRVCQWTQHIACSNQPSS